VLDYNLEADDYDATRGGEERAAAAAGAIEQLLPERTRTVVDLACGTGIVTRLLRHPQRTVVGLDRSPGMLARAAHRLPRRVVLGDATRLPLAPSCVDAVVIIWLLHLLPDAAPVLAEAARVLRPGGVLITTVDKNQAAFTVPSDVAEVTRSARASYARNATDRFASVVAEAAGLGLRPAGETGFPGTGQGRSPRHWRQQVLAGQTPWFRNPDTDPGQRTDLAQALSALPDQETPRPDPVYRLICLELRH
jgi:SAM-dependent methyltransferase